ncbi:YfhO family protein, partial [Nocardia cyriacigeorgica]|nr:YfhO family protein [Nocardia cyriacigeorgica]
WKWVDYPGHEDYISVLERVDGLLSTRSGRIAHSDGVTATSLGESDLTSRIRVDSDTGGKVVFARLGWPGYRASIDGREVPISVVAKTFVAVDIPPGTEGAELVLSWRPPGWKIGGAAIVAGLIGLAVMEWAYLRGRRRDTDEPAEPPSAEPETPEPDEPDLVEART